MGQGFQQLQEIAKTEAGGVEGRTTEGRNVALKVTGFDLQANQTIGINLVTGLEERIALREDKVVRKFVRADVPAWSGNGKGGTRHKSYTELGGVILFENVFRYPQGDTAKWGTTVSHTPTEATVFVEPASLYMARSGAYCLDIIHTKSARIVGTLDELKEALTKALADNKYSAAIVRFENINESGVKTHIMARDETGRIVSRSIKVDGGYENIEAHEAVDIFLETKWGQILKTSIGKDFTTEVIPVERIFAGKDTQEKLAKKTDPLRHYKNEGGGYGFTSTIITYRRHPEGGKFFSAEPIPTSTKPTLHAMENVPTKHMQPETAPLAKDPGNRLESSGIGRQANGDEHTRPDGRDDHVLPVAPESPKVKGFARR